MSFIIPKKVLCVFAHPDDETFGPGGTLALWSQAGTEIHILCATKGEEGGDGNHLSTGQIREQEIRTAAKMLGVRSVEFLGYIDGKLCNTDLERLERLITDKVNDFRPDTLLTFDLNGVSGHIDHMVMASATAQVFKKSPIVQRLFNYTVLKQTSDQMYDYFIYFPDGKERDQVDLIVDILPVWSTRVQAMNVHLSQMHDVQRILKRMETQSKEEYFTIKEKKKVKK